MDGNSFHVSAAIISNIMFYDFLLNETCDVWPRSQVVLEVNPKQSVSISAPFLQQKGVSFLERK